MSTQGVLGQSEHRPGGLVAERSAIVKGAELDGRKSLDDIETVEFREESAEIQKLRERIAELKEERDRSDALHTAATRLGGASEESAEMTGRRWAEETARRIHRTLGGGEQRTVLSGSIDVPTLVPQPVVPLPFKNRLIDHFGARRNIESQAFEFFQQVARTNNAAPVADLGTKPTTTLTMQAVSGYAYFIATVTEPAPVRLLWHFPTVVDWLYTQLYGVILDTIEQQAISGNGTGVNQTGVCCSRAGSPYSTT